MVVSLLKGGIVFFDTSTGNQIGSRIPTPEYTLIASSPDGQHIIACHATDFRCALDIWSVRARAHAKAIAKELEYQKIEHINYSVDGEKVIIVSSPNPLLTPDPPHISPKPSSSRNTRSSNMFDCQWDIGRPSRSASVGSPLLISIWDVKTDKLRVLKQLKVARTTRKVAMSNTSEVVVADNLGIKIIDIMTGYPLRVGPILTPFDDCPSAYGPTRLIWSSSGQTSALASASVSAFASGTTSTQDIIDLACSPDSSKVVAILGDKTHKDEYDREMTLSMWCMRSGNLVGTTSFKLATDEAAISFAADGRDILICCFDNEPEWITDHQPKNASAILLRFSVIPTYLETYMHRPLKFHPSRTPHTIEYSHYISRPIDDIDYASHVDADGWILNTKGEREIWTPWANYELLCSCKPPPKGQTEYRTLKVRDPDTKIVVLIYVITFQVGHYRSKPLPVPSGSS